MPKGAISAGGSAELSFTYIARTPDSKAKIVAKLEKTGNCWHRISDR